MQFHHRDVQIHGDDFPLQSNTRRRLPIVKMKRLLVNSLALVLVTYLLSPLGVHAQGRGEGQCPGRGCPNGPPNGPPNPPSSSCSCPKNVTAKGYGDFPLCCASAVGLMLAKGCPCERVATGQDPCIRATINDRRTKSFNFAGTNQAVREFTQANCNTFFTPAEAVDLGNQIAQQCMRFNDTSGNNNPNTDGQTAQIASACFFWAQGIKF